MHMLSIVIVFALTISKCRLKYSEEHNYLGNITFVQAQLDNLGKNDTYRYFNLPDTYNLHEHDEYDLAEDGQLLTRRKPWPTMIHCRWLINYCWTPCVFRMKLICKSWGYLCVYGKINFNIDKRCRKECVRLYREMRIKYPVPPKRPGDVKNKLFDPAEQRPRFKDSYEVYSDDPDYTTSISAEEH